MMIHCHNRGEVLAQAKGKAALLRYPSGDRHVLLPNGQQVREEPKDRKESGKARRKRMKFARRYTREISAANAARHAAKLLQGSSVAEQETHSLPVVGSIPAPASTPPVAPGLVDNETNTGGVLMDGAAGATRED